MSEWLHSPAALIAVAVGAWWFLTGGVFWLCRQPRELFPLILGVGVVLFALSFVSLHWSLGEPSPEGLVTGFLSGLMIWAFQELTFYLGYVTGPRRKPCESGCRGWRHFLHALEASLYHEVSILLTFLAMLTLSWGEPNQIGLWTFILIWAMHQSARINVMVGVRNVNAAWLPEHLAFLSSFLRTSSLTTFFIISTGCILLLFVVLVDLLTLLPSGSPEQITILLLATLTGLALLEHICLVLPVPLTALWRIFGAPSADLTSTGATTRGRTHEL